MAEREKIIRELNPLHNLPLSLTSFIGRESEFAALKELLCTKRLLTLTGAGGVGKTRLALELARSLLPEFYDGVWLVELAQLDDQKFIPAALAEVLQFRQPANQPLLTALDHFLKPKHLLLILDNCEHLIAETARITELLLRSCPTLHILTTSREILGIPAETIWRVPSLSLPDKSAAKDSMWAADFEAVTLFCDRASAVKSDFELMPEIFNVVIDICQQLDGIPLAIELAAATTAMMPVEQIQRRLKQTLGERFRLLNSGNRTALPHQQTLKATTDWSYNLLSPKEQILLNRLAIFASGSTLDTIEKVCGGTGIEVEEVANLLRQLVNKSLVQVVNEVVVFDNYQQTNQGRYSLLETVRQYAHKKLEETGENFDLHCRLLDYYLELCNQLETELRSPRQLNWLDFLTKELASIRSALAFGHSLLANGNSAVLQLMIALRWFWIVKGQAREGSNWLKTSLELFSNPSLADELLIGKVNQSLGMLSWAQGNIDETLYYSKTALAIYRKYNYKHGIAQTLIGLCSASFTKGDYKLAYSLLEEGRTALLEVGDKWFLAVSAFSAYHNKVEQGKLTEVQHEISFSLQLFREIGDRSGIWQALARLGQLYHLTGDFEAATGCFQESMEVATELGDKTGVAMTLNGKGYALLYSGKFADARPILEECAALFEENQNYSQYVTALIGLAQVELYLVNYASAETLLNQALASVIRSGDSSKRSEILLYLGLTLAKLGAAEKGLDFIYESFELAQQAQNPSGMYGSLTMLASILACLREPAMLEKACLYLGLAQHLQHQYQLNLPAFLVDQANKRELETKLRQYLGAFKFDQLVAQGATLTIDHSFDDVPLIAQVDVKERPQLKVENYAISSLTGREVEVLELAATGLKNNEIAQRLVITPGTVKIHLSSIYGKLAVNSRTAAVHTARELKII